jgi:ATP-dependent DNA helicase RecQ
LGGSEPREAGSVGGDGHSAGPAQARPAPLGGSEPREAGSVGGDGHSAGPAQARPAPLGGSEPREAGSVGGDAISAGPPQARPAPLGSVGVRCGNCDNCIKPPDLHDATEAARKILSCIYRVQQASGMAFGSGHIMDILRGKQTDKMAQYAHDKLSTFGIGADLSEAQWRALLRQLIAREAIYVDAAHFNTLHLAEGARDILKGGAQVWMKQASEKPGRSRSGRNAAKDVAPDGQPLSLAQRECLDALKAWRAEVAREHNLPAFVIFHDATLRALAAQMPQTLADLDGVAGIGQKKREAYGREVIRVVSAFV